MKIVVIGGTGRFWARRPRPREGLKESMAGAQVVIDLAQNGDGLRADQAGAADHHDLHG